MGFGDDWKAAVEKVKSMHPPPGGKPAAVRDMLFEAVDYLRKHDMITVPQVAAESLRMNMMSPERQLINPFFTGGAQITVSFPTDTMEYEARLQACAATTSPSIHATAFHEMIPGHNLVGLSGRALRGLSRQPGRDAVLRRGLAALLGDHPLRQGLPRHAGGEGRRAVLADAPGRADHLLDELPPRRLVAAGVHRFPRRPRRPRARQRDRRSAPLVPAGGARSIRPRTCSAACRSTACARSSWARAG